MSDREEAGSIRLSWGGGEDGAQAKPGEQHSGERTANVKPCVPRMQCVSIIIVECGCGWTDKDRRGPRRGEAQAVCGGGRGFGVCSNSNWNTSEHFKPETDVTNLCAKEVIHADA